MSREGLASMQPERWHLASPCGGRPRTSTRWIIATEQHTASGLAPSGTRGIFRCTLTGKQLWPQSGRGFCPDVPPPPPPPPPSPNHVQVQSPEWRDGAVGLQCVCSRRCAWARGRQFPHASHVGNRASGCFPLASTNPIFMEPVVPQRCSRVVGRCEIAAPFHCHLKSPRRCRRRFGPWEGSWRSCRPSARLIQTLCVIWPVSFAAKDWLPWKNKSAGRLWARWNGTAYRAGLRWGAMEPEWSRDRLVPECRDGSQRKWDVAEQAHGRVPARKDRGGLCRETDGEIGKKEKKLKLR
ncbi:hypothetical protein QBC39DRAFT_158525 [Podospora conica]|nr:hypothetical protein QBC39DRAFT_158525 [Schizothecium conicum]